MTPSTKNKRPIAKLKFSVGVEVYRPDFVLFESIQHLDVAGLERSARAEIEVGYLKTDCCLQIVRATVRKGMVTALKSNPASDNKRQPATEEMTRLLNEVMRKAPRGPQGPARLPVSVAVFLANARRIITEGVHCWAVCYQGHCVVCCQSETTGMWLCSEGGFVIKSG